MVRIEVRREFEHMGVSADASRAATQPSDGLVANINSIRDRQADIQSAAEQIHHELAGY